MSNPFDFINSINSKNYIWDEKFSNKDYNPFMVNNGFSYFADTVLLVNEMNRYNTIPLKCQYTFLFQAINKKKRFSKWVKRDDIDNTLELIMKHYNISAAKAKDVLSILSNDQIEIIRQKQYIGGKD